MKIGLMGCGAVAQYGHLPAIQQVNDLALHAIYDPVAANLTTAQAKFGVPHAFTDAASFFASGIEAVSITSPAPCHKENVLAAARHRLPVLCEKPLALDQVAAAEMIAAMQQANVSLYSAFCYRFSPAALKIRELVRAGAIGEVRSLRLIYIWSLHGKYADDGTGRRIIQKRRADRMQEGGPMVDCGTHQIDLATFWLDSAVTRFHGHGAWVDEYEAPDHMWLHLDHANGAHTCVEISYSYHHTSKNQRAQFSYELIGTHGVIHYDVGQQLFKMEDETGEHRFEFHGEKNFTGLYSEWAQALHSGKSELLTSAAAGMRVVEIAREATNQAIRDRPPHSLPAVEFLPTQFFQNLRAGLSQTVVVYGTSLTAGGAWVTALRHWLDEQYPQQVKFVNSGGPGENSDWGITNLAAKVLVHRPDLVFIEFSYNDAHEKFQMPLARGATNLAAIVRVLREQNPQLAIVLQTMNVGWDAPNGNRSLSIRPQLVAFNENYRRCARADRLPLLDHYQNWLTLKQEAPDQFQAFIPDGTHPTDAGSLAVTWPVIRTFLEQAQQAARIHP